MPDPTILILASLADGDKHGYAIMEDMQVFGGIRLGPGTLYGAICRLEARGSIRAVKSEPRRQPYRITAEGSEHLKEQLAVLGQVVRRKSTNERSMRTLIRALDFQAGSSLRRHASRSVFEKFQVQAIGRKTHLTSRKQKMYIHTI
jgi:DNA-binding PadR family transcriptional regulator